MAKRYNEMDIGGLIEEFVSALLQISCSRPDMQQAATDFIISDYAVVKPAKLVEILSAFFLHS
jgi:hypothetical protein